MSGRLYRNQIVKVSDIGLRGFSLSEGLAVMVASVNLRSRLQNQSLLMVQRSEVLWALRRVTKSASTLYLPSTCNLEGLGCVASWRCTGGSLPLTCLRGTGHGARAWAGRHLSRPRQVMSEQVWRRSVFLRTYTHTHTQTRTHGGQGQEKNETTKKMR